MAIAQVWEAELETMSQSRVGKINPPPIDEPERRIILAIGKYILNNPGAKDTEEGVMKWWMGEKYSKEKIGKALRWFVEQDWIIQRSLPGGKQIFCMNPEYQKIISHYFNR